MLVGWLVEVVGGWGGWLVGFVCVCARAWFLYSMLVGNAVVVSWLVEVVIVVGWVEWLGWFYFH